MSRLARYFSRFVRDRHTLRAIFFDLCAIDIPCTHFSSICAEWTLLARTFLKFVRGWHALLAFFHNLCGIDTLCTLFSTICVRWTLLRQFYNGIPIIRSIYLVSSHYQKNFSRKDRARFLFISFLW